jgi:outer membrane protein
MFIVVLLERDSLRMNVQFIAKKIAPLVMGAGLLLATVVSSATAFAADTVGYVDFAKLLSGYEQFQSFQADSKVKEAEINKMKADFVKQLEDNRKAAASNPIANENMEKQLAEKFRVRVADYQTWLNTKTKDIDTRVNATIKAVAQKQGVSVVLDKDQVLVGGVDLTNEVISTLNKPATAMPAVAPAHK